MPINKRSIELISIIDRTLSELLDIENRARRERDFAVALQRFERWKTRTVNLLSKEIGHTEAKRLEAVKGKYDTKSDEWERLEGEVSVHLAMMQAFREELQNYPETVLSIPNTTQTASLHTPAMISSKTVFVVYGRNDNYRKAIFAFLRAIRLSPLEWSQTFIATAKPSPYIGEILDITFKQAQAVVVMFTGDDEARLKQKFWRNDDPADEKKLSPQPRPNVIFEAGMALGRNEDRTILVQVGKIRHISDIAGRHITYLDNTPNKRQELINKLIAAGCQVEASGSDWLSEGNFE